MPELMPPPLALYIHIPWCVKKCPYCDFNSHGQKSELPVADYIAALTRDLEQDLPLVWGRSISSVFFGGGTPSLFSGAAIGEILSMANSRLRFAPNCEITLECNPGTAEHDRFASYLAAGVNRLSFGVQSFDDGCLERLGRIHDAERARVAVISAQDAGFANINLDLMYALPQQTLAMALNDVEQALALNPQHLSHYQLTLEPNTLFAAKPPAGIPEMDDAWDMQEACIARMAEAGFSQYEVSAYAREGRRCQHNLNYWTYGDYLGIGAGAHGKISSGHDGRILRRWKPKHPETYIASAGTQAGIGGDEFVLPENRPFDYMLNALRLVDGFSLADFEVRTGLNRESIKPQLDEAVQRGWLEISGDWAKPTELGMRFANDVMGLFLK
ncbi:radical SAM family heme chaperone HemW [Arenimonas sp. GDDSR-1]|uniref:radical SAM family heme chaperone HemW n=1 Tax=Arenimonas sp. GDDSR-1 TaxID=2950125 RepID=UPI002637DDCA|nr:radical SAM family heme chaperone HemW [Arenimonas sp. GDDSR-1]